MTYHFDGRPSAFPFAALLAAVSLVLAGCGDRAPAPDLHDHDEAAHDHEEAEGHDHVELSAEDREALGIVLGAVSTGPVGGWIELPGEVRFDENRIALVSAPVEGVIREVHASVGDVVEAGDLLAIVDSRELAEAKADYLSALASLELVRPEFERERELFDRGVSTESRFQTARRELEEARIAVRSAGFQLEALGIDEAARETLADPQTGSLSRYALRAPMSGVITQRHAVRGEFAEAGDVMPTFTIADASQVWVDAAIYGPDLMRVRTGARARIRVSETRRIETEVSFVAPQIGTETRTGLARLIVDNDAFVLMPGAFVTVELEDSEAGHLLRVPASAIQRLEGESVVFVPEEDGFEPRPVRLGRRGADFVEILSGLETGEEIVVSGAFALKSELQKGAFGDGHNH